MVTLIVSSSCFVNLVPIRKSPTLTDTFYMHVAVIIKINATPELKLMHFIIKVSIYYVDIINWKSKRGTNELLNSISKVFLWFLASLAVSLSIIKHRDRSDNARVDYKRKFLFKKKNHFFKSNIVYFLLNIKNIWHLHVQKFFFIILSFFKHKSIHFDDVTLYIYVQ